MENNPHLLVSYQLTDTLKKTLSTKGAIPMTVGMKRGKREERRIGQQHFAQS